MKKTHFLVCAFLFLLTSSCNKGFDKIPESEVNTAERDAAGLLATRILKAHNESKFDTLSETETTADFRNAFTPEKQKASHETIKGLWGDFVSLKYAESAKPRDGTMLKIYRFKGTFKGSSAEPEIRVVIDGAGKLAGFWLKSWNDMVL